MYGFADDQVHRPVDAGTGVPPGVLVRGGVHLDDVLLSDAEVLADRHGEVGVAVRAVARERAVHPHGCAAVHALELEQHALPAQLLVGDEGLLVLPDTAGKESVAPVLVGVAPPTDHRVVREPHRLPGLRSAAEELLEMTHLRPDAPVVIERGAVHVGSPDSG